MLSRFFGRMGAIPDFPPKMALDAAKFRRDCWSWLIGVELRVVAAVGTSEYVDVGSLRTEAEREECEWLLTSGVLGRAANLARVLRYVCEEHFHGRGDQIKEYSIAVEALNRRTAFDPQTDTIVRVTVHALRKRLMEIYQTEGAGRPVRLILPPGHYAPSFIHQRAPGQPPRLRAEEDVAPVTQALLIPMAERALESNVAQQRPGKIVWKVAAWSLLAFVVAAVALVSWSRTRESKKAHPAEVAISAAGLPAPAPQAVLHALMGVGRASYVDHSGITWSTGNYCQSGNSVSLPNERIEGTEDPPLYQGGVRGIAHCIFPVTQGMYELHFHFAETSDLPAATRMASISINAGPALNVDVVDDAGGHNLATTIVVTGVSPENDGSIHLDFVSEVSLLNAVEMLPATSSQQLPVRIVANPSPVTDDLKQVWDSDRYFIGGRHGRPPRGPALSTLGIYQSDRIGLFRYNIPAIPNAHYRLKLYFREPWFGRENGGMGGPGSRVFDVACNGLLLMKNFDILAEGNSKPIVKTFEHVQANAWGRIELYFMPVMNYPEVNAIEVVQED